jgi:hypothetical protein
MIGEMARYYEDQSEALDWAADISDHVPAFVPDIRCSRRGCSCGGFIHPGIEIRTGERSKAMTHVQSEIERAERRLERLYARAEAVSQFGTDEDYPDETVLLFKVRFSGAPTVFTYTAIKITDRWFVSGPRQAGVPVTFDTLVEKWLTQASEVWIVSEWEPM